MRGLSPGRVFLVVLVLTIASIFGEVAHDLVFSSLRTWFDLGPAIGVRLAGLSAIALLLVATTWLLWRHPARETSPGSSGLVLLLSALATIYSVTNAVSFALSARDIYAIELAVSEQENAEMALIGPGGLSIVGAIGDSFMADFLAAEKAHGSISWIEISSPGGLVGESLALAKLVETRRTTVIVRGECFSACVLIAVASPESYAEEDAVFGFHRTSPLAEIRSEIAIFGYQETDKLADKFLRDHGVPDSIMCEASKHGSDSVHLVGAPEMVSSGAIRGILKDNVVVQTGPKK